MQQIDWTLTARWFAPLVALFVGAALTRYLERRPRLLVYIAHSTAVKIKAPEGASFSPFDVHTHSVVIRNGGAKAAMNVRLGHHFLPSFSIYPTTNYTVADIPDGGKEILFPVLVPGEQHTITYLYYPPLLWSGVHSYQKSDEGLARQVRVLPTPQPARWVRALTWTLMAIGALALVFVSVQALGHWLSP